MKLEVLKNNVESFGDRKTTKFGIDEENLGLVYKSFLNYSNPIGSLVREITSNCFDSHEEAGINIPITVKITDEDYLNGNPAMIHFIDYGVGLSPQRVEDVYCKFFTSTKRETDTLIGGFGIGGKSPLGYNDMFYVKTNYEGKQYTYIVHKGEKSPEMDLIDECDTDEGNGTEVIVNIKSGDTEKFKKEIKEQLKYFDNINFINCGVENYTITKESVFIYNSNSGSTFGREIDICIGRVRYPIDRNIIYVDSKIRNLPLGLYFDIGEISVIWTRESIEYNDKTIEAITNKLKQAIEFIEQRVDKEIEKIKDLDSLIDQYIKNKRNSSNTNKTVYINVAGYTFDAYNFNNYRPSIVIDGINLTFNDLDAKVGHYFPFYGIAEHGRIKPLKYSKNIFKQKESYLVLESTVPVVNYFLCYHRTTYEVCIFRYNSELHKGFYASAHEKEIRDKLLSRIQIYDDIEIDDIMKEDYKAFLQSRRKKKKSINSNESFYYYLYGWTSYSRFSMTYQQLAKEKRLFVIGTLSDSDNLKKLHNFINKTNKNITVAHVSQENFDFIMNAGFPNVMYYGDFLKSKYITRIVQKMADYKCYASIAFDSDFIAFFPNNPFVKLAKKWIGLEHVNISDALIKQLPEPHPELVMLKEFYSGLRKFIKYEAPLFNLFLKHHTDDEYMKRDIDKYLKNFKLNNYKYYGKLSKNIDNQKQ